jgi:hypothetical protein
LARFLREEIRRIFVCLIQRKPAARAYAIDVYRLFRGKLDSKQKIA